MHTYALLSPAQIILLATGSESFMPVSQDEAELLYVPVLMAVVRVVAQDLASERA